MAGNEPVTTGTRTVTSNPRQLSDGNPVGTLLGQGPTDLVGFFNATPVVQPGLNGLPARTSQNITIYASTQSPSAVGPNTSAEKSMSVSGVLATDMVAVVNKPTTDAGIIVGTGRVSGAGTVQVTFGNDTAATITPTSGETYLIVTIGAAFQTTVTLTPAAVGPNTTSEQYFAVPGVQSGMMVFVNKPTTQAGLVITNCRAAGPGQVAIQFQNLTAATITPTAGQSYVFAAASAFSPAPVMTVIQAALTPASVAANTTAAQNFTVPGLVAGTEVFVTKPSVTPNLVVSGARVSAANTLTISYANNTGSPITPPAETYLVAYFPTAAPAAGSGTAIPSQPGESEASLVQLGLASGG